MHCGPCSWRELVRVSHFLGEHSENCASGGVLSRRTQSRNIVRERNEIGFHLFFQNLRGASGLCESDAVFWTEDLIEETTKRLQDSFPTQSRTSNPVLYTLAFGTKTLNMRASPTLNIRKKLPILIQTGGHNKQARWTRGKRPSPSASENRPPSAH